MGGRAGLVVKEGWRVVEKKLGGRAGAADGGWGGRAGLLGGEGLVVVVVWGGGVG